MTGIAVATTSTLATDAAREIAECGGNAVDCALAASLVQMNTEPGVCALAGGAYITIWSPDTDPVTIDGNVAVPGLGGRRKIRADSVTRVALDYGGGIETLVGTGSVGVPGSLAAVESAWKRFGNARWQDIFAPSIRATQQGFPLPTAANYYLGYSGKPIYGRSDDGYRALHDGDRLRDAGSHIVVPHLADSLAIIAEEGAPVFYEGDIAAAIVAHCEAGRANLTAKDMREYRAIERPALLSTIGQWQIATNPPPAVGGVVLSAMISAFERFEANNWNTESLAQLIDVQQTCLDYRKRHLDLADDMETTGARMLDEARSGRLLSHWTSSSTVHTSTVDSNGLACAITASSGYGSGEMPEGTGLWLNNCLGELELNRRGLDAGPPGSRLPSNMAPSVARHGDRVIALGSPGADRITTAIHQFLVNALHFGMPLADACARPRVHIDTSGQSDRLMAESGLPLPKVAVPVKEFDGLSMYFGGVGAARHSPGAGFDVAADPRRAGATLIVDA